MSFWRPLVWLRCSSVLPIPLTPRGQPAIQMTCRRRRLCDLAHDPDPKGALSRNVGAGFPKRSCANQRPPFLARLGVEKLENLSCTFGTDARNLAQVRDRGPLDLLQCPEM